MLALKFSLTVGSIVALFLSQYHVRSVTSTNEEEHNVWNPLLDTLVEYQSGHLLLSSSKTRRQPDWVSQPDSLWTSCFREETKPTDETSSQQLSVPFGWFAEEEVFKRHGLREPSQFLRQRQRHSPAAWRLLQFLVQVFLMTEIALACVPSHGFSTVILKKHRLYAINSPFCF